MTTPRKRVIRDENGDVIPDNVIQLDPIEIEGSVERANALPPEEEALDPVPDWVASSDNVVELDPIEIEGSVSRANLKPLYGGRVPPAYDVEATREFEEARRAEREGNRGPLADWIVDTAEQDDGTTGIVLPEWFANRFDDEEGNAPTGALDALKNLLMQGAADAGPGEASRLARTGRAEMPESDRTLHPLSMLQGLSQAGSFGLADDAVAGLGHFGVPGATEQAEDMRSNQRWADREHPVSEGAGEGVAALAQMMATPAAAAGHGATALRGAGLSALESGAYGLVEGMGRSEADTLGGRAMDALPNAAIGLGLGGLFGGLARRNELLAEEPTGAAIERLQRQADLQWASHAGVAGSAKRQGIMGGSADPEERIESIQWMMQQLRDRGALEGRGPRGMFPQQSDDIAQVALDAGEAGNRAIQEAAEGMDGSTVDVGPILNYLDTRAAELDRIPGGGPRARELRARAAEFRANDIADWRQVQDWKNDWFDPRVLGSENPMNVERAGVYGAIRDAMQDSVERVTPTHGPAYREGREASLVGSRFRRMAADNDLNEARNRITSLSDYLAGITGGAGVGIPLALAADVGTGGSVTAAGAAALALGRANQFARSNHHGMRALSMERTIRTLQENPERLGQWASRLQAAQQRGPRAFNAALYLAAQQDENVRRAMSDTEERENMQQMNEDRDDFFTEDSQPGDIPPPSEEELAEFFQ